MHVAHVTHATEDIQARVLLETQRKGPHWNPKAQIRAETSLKLMEWEVVLALFAFTCGLAAHL